MGGARPRARHRRAKAGLALCLLITSAVACSDDTDDGAEAPEATTTTTAATTTTTTAATTTSTARPPASSRSLPIVTESPGIAPGFNVRRPSDLGATGEPLPIVVWANGGCVRHDATWSILFERWAAAGFFVVSLAPRPAADGTAPSVPTDPAEALADPTSVDDHAALVDWAIAQSEADGGPYTDRLDTARVVAAGNSCGGITALGLASRDTRVTSVFVLSGSSRVPGASAEQAAQVMDGVTAPVGFVVGAAAEDIAFGPANQDVDVLAEGIPAMVVSRSSGDHLTVSTDPSILTDVAEIALDWMDLTLYGSEGAATTLRSPTVCAGCEPGVWSLRSEGFAASS